MYELENPMVSGAGFAPEKPEHEYTLLISGYVTVNASSFEEAKYLASIMDMEVQDIELVDCE